MLMHCRPRPERSLMPHSVLILILMTLAAASDTFPGEAYRERFHKPFPRRRAAGRGTAQGRPVMPRCEHRAVSVLTDRIDPGRIACRVCLE